MLIRKHSRKQVFTETAEISVTVQIAIAIVHTEPRFTNVVTLYNINNTIVQGDQWRRVNSSIFTFYKITRKDSKIFIITLTW